jgi:hypothetical protein
MGGSGRDIKFGFLEMRGDFFEKFLEGGKRMDPEYEIYAALLLFLQFLDQIFVFLREFMGEITERMRKTKERVQIEDNGGE